MMVFAVGELVLNAHKMHHAVVTLKMNGSNLSALKVMPSENLYYFLLKSCFLNFPPTQVGLLNVVVFSSLYSEAHNSLKYER